MLAPWALETCSVKDCRANARNDGRFQKGMIFPCRRCRKEVLGRTVGIISLAFFTGWHSARCRNPFFARDGEWHDAKMGFGNIPKRIDEANYNLWWGCASLKLGISDSIVEVSLQGTIRLREQVPKTHRALLLAMTMHTLGNGSFPVIASATKQSFFAVRTKANISSAHSAGLWKLWRNRLRANRVEFCI